MLTLLNLKKLINLTFGIFFPTRLLTEKKSGLLMKRLPTLYFSIILFCRTLLATAQNENKKVVNYDLFPFFGPLDFIDRLLFQLSNAVSSRHRWQKPSLDSFISLNFTFMKTQKSENSRVTLKNETISFESLKSKFIFQLFSMSLEIFFFFLCGRCHSRNV